MKNPPEVESNQREPATDLPVWKGNIYAFLYALRLFPINREVNAQNLAQKAENNAREPVILGQETAAFHVLLPYVFLNLPNLGCFRFVPIPWR